MKSEQAEHGKINLHNSHTNLLIFLKKEKVEGAWTLEKGVWKLDYKMKVTK